MPGDAPSGIESMSWKASGKRGFDAGRLARLNGFHFDCGEFGPDPWAEIIFRERSRVFAAAGLAGEFCSSLGFLSWCGLSSVRGIGPGRNCRYSRHRRFKSTLPVGNRSNRKDAIDAPKVRFKREREVLISPNGSGHVLETMLSCIFRSLATGSMSSRNRTKESPTHYGSKLSLLITANNTSAW